MKLTSIVRAVAVAVVAAGSGALVALPAQAAPADHLIINEAYNNGGSANAAYRTKFVELHNPTSSDVSLSGWSLQYRSATGTGAYQKYDLSGTIEAGGYFLISGNSNGANGEVLPAADVTAGFNSSGTTGSLALVHSTTALPATVTGNVVGEPSTTHAIVDFLGYGTSNTFETAVSPAPSANSVPQSINRTGAADTNVNSADFSLSASVTPCNTDGCPEPPVEEPEEPPVDKTIEEIQGTGDASPLAGTNVTTTGVVTAVYPTGGFNGAYIQTPGTGGDPSADGSSGVFVFGSAVASAVERGDFVEVTGEVSEFNGLTEITVASAADVEVLTGTPAPVVPAEVTFPLSAAEREDLEGMLLLPRGDLTVTNNYTTNQYGEVGLTDGDEPLQTPTNVVQPGAPAIALQAENNARLITLDDGSSVDFLGSATNKDQPLPWLSRDNEVRVGAAVTFDEPVVLDYRFGWKLQPTERLTGPDGPVTFESTRTPAPEDVGGEVSVGTFNVLNYFPTTAADYVADGGQCTTYNDREGEPVTANRCGTPSTGSGNGPRGAAEDDDLERQQAKIVSAMNAFDADVVSLEEIENSTNFNAEGDRDVALATLVDALNAAAEETRWAYVPSPADAPGPGDGEDVIRTAFIYQPDVVEPVGESDLLDDPAFDEARDPLAQAFRPVGGSAATTFAVIVNHFKSKGSGPDENDGQGASNAARVAQAEALVDFADEFAVTAGTDKVFLTGDFNAYNEEDPVEIIEEAGYVNVPRQLVPEKETYQFEGQVGSLDHIFVTEEGFGDVTGADVWDINADEALAREYSRHNYNVTDLYRADPYRASDHDPALVGFDVTPAVDGTTTTVDAPRTVRRGADIDLEVDVTSQVGTPTGDVVVTEGETEVTSGTLSGGSLVLDLSDLAVGEHVLTVKYEGDETHEGSLALVRITVLPGDAGLTATAGSSPYGTSAVVEVEVDPGAEGMVYVGNGSDVVGIGTVEDGAASVAIDKTLMPGDYELDVYYGGSDTFDATQTTVDLTVVKAATTTSKQFVTAKVVVKKTKAWVTFDVKAAGFTVEDGSFRIGSNGKWYTTKVVNGRANVQVGAYNSTGTKTIKGEFLGNAVAAPSKGQFTIKVVAK